MKKKQQTEQTPEARTYFAFKRLYYEVWKNISTNEKKARMMQAIALYGFEQVEPDLSDDDELLTIWKNIIRPDIVGSWKQYTLGTHGGNMSAMVRDAKRSEKTIVNDLDPDNAEQTPRVLPKDIDWNTYPDYEVPTKEFVEFLEHNRLLFIKAAPKTLCGKQLRWLYDNLGEYQSGALIYDIEKYIKANGGLSFWTDPEHANLSVGTIVKDYWLKMEAEYDRWLMSSFPKIHAAKHRLSFLDYQKLRGYYGRANVLKKMCQLNSKTNIYQNTKIFDSLETFLKRSTESAKNSKFYLPKYDDQVTDLTVPECKEGYDRLFYLHVAALLSVKE